MQQGHVTACPFVEVTMDADSHPAQDVATSLASSPEPLLVVEDLRKAYVLRRSLGDRVRHSEAGRVAAIDGVSFNLVRGETLGIAGESGSGTTTVVRCLIRLIDPIRVDRLWRAGRARGLRRPAA